jgi:hypothetical protein
MMLYDGLFSKLSILLICVIYLKDYIFVYDSVINMENIKCNVCNLLFETETLLRNHNHTRNHLHMTGNYIYTPDGQFIKIKEWEKYFMDDYFKYCSIKSDHDTLVPYYILSTKYDMPDVDIYHLVHNFGFKKCDTCVNLYYRKNGKKNHDKSELHISNLNRLNDGA